MIEKLRELKQMIYNRLPARWGLRSKVQQITNSLTEIHEIKLEIKNPENADLNEIRKFILLHPYTVSTRPVRTKITETDHGNFELTISFVVMNTDQGNKIEDQIRDRYLLKNKID